MSITKTGTIEHRGPREHKNVLKKKFSCLKHWYQTKTQIWNVPGKQLSGLWMKRLSK